MAINTYSKGCSSSNIEKKILSGQLKCVYFPSCQTVTFVVFCLWELACMGVKAWHQHLALLLCALQRTIWLEAKHLSGEKLRPICCCSTDRKYIHVRLRVSQTNEIKWHRNNFVALLPITTALCAQLLDLHSLSNCWWRSWCEHDAVQSPNVQQWERSRDFWKRVPS